MNSPPNPFLRGFTQFDITRVLLITPEDEPCLHYRLVHSLQADFPDSQLVGNYCHFGNEFALVNAQQQLPVELTRQCPQRGFVLSALHSIAGEQADAAVLIGHAHSREAAQNVVRQLSFDTGHYSRCWEISTQHLTPTSLRWLEGCADESPSPSVLFHAFHIPGSRGAVGVLLQATPWTDANLSTVVGIDAGMLRESQELAGMPLQLIHVLQQAALADTRIVIFDPDAPVLEGLLLHD